uniref:Interleukin-4 inducing immunoglobulin-binding domain-containing protein n=1 Tax=Hucho hucho TaxID=62062 RepID=A0A4W5P8V9_9TELE
MLPNTKLCFSHWLLLVGFTCSIWHVNMSSPVVTQTAPITEHCATSAKALLWNVTEALTQENLFKGINCTDPGMELNTRTHTVSVCMTFCNLLNKSTVTYVLPLLSPFHLLALKTQNCFSSSLLGDWSSQAWSQQDTQGTTNQNPFDERVHLCKVLKSFRVRTITINRIIGYI